jgi:hypothetical protein
MFTIEINSETKILRLDSDVVFFAAQMMVSARALTALLRSIGDPDGQFEQSDEDTTYKDLLAMLFLCTAPHKRDFHQERDRYHGHDSRIGKAASPDQYSRNGCQGRNARIDRPIDWIAG